MQRELHANNVEHEILDELCCRGEQLARQVARLVTDNVLDSSVLSTFQVGYQAGKPIESVVYCFYKITLSKTEFSMSLPAQYTDR